MDKYGITKEIVKYFVMGFYELQFGDADRSTKGRNQWSATFSVMDCHFKNLLNDCATVHKKSSSTFTICAVGRKLQSGL